MDVFYANHHMGGTSSVTSYIDLVQLFIFDFSDWSDECV